ncbi:hypothetical protein ACFQ0T_22315 [Kitasatospora gansuensis]
MPGRNQLIAGVRGSDQIITETLGLESLSQGGDTDRDLGPCGGRGSPSQTASVIASTDTIRPGASSNMARMVR